MEPQNNTDEEGGLQQAGSSATGQERFERAWPLDDSERRDFHHRIRVFPPDVARWRRALLEQLADRVSDAPKDEIVARLRPLLDEGLTRLRDVVRILELLLGHPNDTEPVGMRGRGVRTRLRVFRELEEDLRTLGVVLDETTLTPPNVAAALPSHLARHARDVCRDTDPACDRCELSSMCGTARARSIAGARQSGGPTVVDLFAGAGGVSEGFTSAGYRVLLALDQDPLALRTYRYNHPQVPEERVLERDIRGVPPAELAATLANERVDVLIGAPPCQGFSSVGFRSKPGATGYKVTEDARNYLFEHVVRAAEVLRPRLLLMENVPGMESVRRENVSFLELAARMLQEHGFRTAIWRLNAAAFGVPQIRQRCFLVATTGRLLPAAPPEEYQDLLRTSYDLDALPPVTLDESIFDLPPRGPGEGEALDVWERGLAPEDSRARRYLRKFGLLRRSRILYNHTVRYHNERDLELYALLRPGEDSVHALERHKRDDLMRYRRDVFDDKYARLRGDRPCRTIVSHLAKDGNGYIHPTQVRSITLREAARVQSFRDDYAFCGSPSDQWIQLGNAVPPILARAIARSFLQTLKREDR